MNTIAQTVLPHPPALAEEAMPRLLSVSENGAFVLSLPANLKDYQPELEGLLGKVFSGRPRSPNNLALAKQMSINWCVSKCKQAGISVDMCLEMIG